MHYETRPFLAGPADMQLPPLEYFGPRIMVCGTSNTGKSTLAVALGNRLDRPVVHLDQLHFQPYTDWRERPAEEFAALHRQAIAGDDWVMEGNYSRVIGERLGRATGIILLSSNRWVNFARYLRRTLLERDSRLGNLAGNRDSLKWSMVTWVLAQGPRNIAPYRTMLPASGLPFLELCSMRDVRRAYAAWTLTFPSSPAPAGRRLRRCP